MTIDRCKWVILCHMHDRTVEHGGFRAVFWDAPKGLRHAVEEIIVLLDYLRCRHRDIRQGATSQLMVLCNRTAVHNQLLQHGFRTTWRGGLRISTTSSAAGATALIAVIVQTGCGFLSGGRRDATKDDREDCYGRATVALTKPIQHTYILSPVDMAGLVGMAQTLAVFHSGYYTLKRGQVQFHGTTEVPPDNGAILEWGLDTPFTPQNRPPLAIAMIATLNGVRSLRRYRLVLAQKSRLRLTLMSPRLCPRRRRIASLPVDSSPVPLIGNSYMGMPRMDIDLHSGYVPRMMETRC